MKGQAKVIDPESPDPESEPAEVVDGGTTEEAPGSVATQPDPKKGPGQTKAMQAIRLSEDMALKDYLDALGPQGCVRVQVNRTAPKTVRVNGKDYVTEGFQGRYDDVVVDEEFLRDELGGGTYDLTITSRQRTAGSFKYAGHRTVKVAGEPKVEKLPTNAANPSPAPSGDASPGFVKEVVGLLKGELEHAREVKPEGIPPALQVLIDQMREDARRREGDIAQLRRDVAEAHSRKPPEDTFKDKLLGSLVDGESGRIVSIRAQHESEMRTMKEGHLQEIRLIEDRHDRAIKQMQQTHELMLANMKASYEREIAALNTSHQVTTTAAATTGSVTTTTLNAEVKRLEREVDTLRVENKELRERKDKSIFEQIKEFKNLKEAIGEGDDQNDSMAEKVIAAVPMAIESIGGLIDRKRAGQPGQQQVQAAQAQAQAKPRVVTDTTGRRFVQAGDKLIPAKPKPKLITTEAGQQVEIPRIEATMLTLIISQLEAAFGRNEEPEIVAQTGKAQMPPDILAWIRQHHTDQASGIDLFMRQVAKLPGTSPLATQAGRNWLRKVGVALIGE